MTPLTPTREQADIIDAFTTGQSVRVAAGAGTGKTTVLRMAAETAPTRRGLYVAYNKAIASDAEQVFGRNVKVATTHALAFRALGHRYQHRLTGPRVPAGQLARLLGITRTIPLDKGAASPAQQARYVQSMVTAFCASADTEITPAHAPTMPGTSPAEHASLAATLTPLARRMWADKMNPHGGSMPFVHDDYLKAWALTDPDWGAHFITFDEAQDTTPVVAAMVKRQQDRGAQVVVVGDSAQAIYGWRGAVNAMDNFDTPHTLTLTQSWRFGPAVAEEANLWLSLLDAELRLTGAPTQASQVTSGTAPVKGGAVLCRTNAEAINQVVTAQRQGWQVAVVGGGRDARALAEAAQRLQTGQPTWHPELSLFTSWAAVQEYADEPGGSDLRPFVRIIDSVGAAAVLAAIDNCVPEVSADLIVTTAHKAKGREWGTVTIADDFTEPAEDEGIADEDAMLAYVAVTRARQVLHRGGLAWVDSWATPTGIAKARQARQTAPTARSAPAPASAPPAAGPMTVTLDPTLAAEVTALAGATGATPDHVVTAAVRAHLAAHPSAQRKEVISA